MPRKVLVLSAERGEWAGEDMQRVAQLSLLAEDKN